MFLLSAQSPLTKRYKRFEYITIRDGLSQSGIYCIWRDSRGFMWFGTQDGLNRYDGYTFEVYNHDPGDPNTLVNNYIYSLYESNHAPGILWIGTAAGLCKLDMTTRTITSFRNDPTLDNCLKNVSIKVIIGDREGNLWLGTRGEGLNKFNIKSCSVTQYKNTPHQPRRLGTNNVTALVQDLEGNYWIGSDGGGLSKFNIKNNTFTIYKGEPGNPNGLSHNSILSLFCDRSTGDIWIGTDGSGMTRLHRDKHGHKTFSHFTYDPANSNGLPNNNVRAIYRDSTGLLWIGTRGGRLCSLQLDTGQFEDYTYGPDNPYGLENDNIAAIFEDQAGSLWFGTQGGGIKKINKNQGNFLLYFNDPNHPEGLKHDQIWDIHEGNNGIFQICTNGGLYLFDLEKETFRLLIHNRQYPENLDYNRLFCVCPDEFGDLWLGSDGGGLYKYDSRQNKFYQYRHDPGNPTSLSHDQIRTIFRDSKGVLWIGTEEKGISCLYPENRKNMVFKRYVHIPGDPDSLSHNRVFCITGDQKGTIWIGTVGGGLNRFNRDSQTFSHFKKDNIGNCLSDNRVISIYIDSPGLLWIGTTGGLNKFEPQRNKWTHYTTKDGLPNNVIYGILEEEPAAGQQKGNLWISTNKGLSRFNRETGEFKNYDVQDGLQSSEFNKGACAKSKNGLMFFGGINGFNVFDPAEIKANPYVPPVVLTDFQIFYQPVPISPTGNSPLKKSITETRRIRLTYRQNSFSFQFAALNYINPQKNQYAYMLEGFDHDWIPLKKRQMASYTNIPPGDYVFRVKGSNNDGVWNEKGTSVVITIEPPFWLTWWFKLLMVILFFGVLIFLHKMRTNVLKQKLEKDRLERELKLKADFTAMLVHDLRSPLTAVIGYSEMLTEYPPETLDVAKTGRAITISSEKMLNLINDMLDLSKFEAGKMSLHRESLPADALIKLVTDTIEIMRPLLDKKKINLQWNPELGNNNNIKEKPLSFDLEKIGQVVNNLLSNAIKFAPVNGTITIEVCQPDTQFLELSVTDDGPGIPPGKQKFLFAKYTQLSTGQKVKGTGLGLAVSKLIIDSHQGTIGYRPGHGGKGSTFYFRLPFK
jgi:two-component system sensor histidine kinase ChiS